MFTEVSSNKKDYTWYIKQLTAQDIMTQNLLTVPRDMPVKELSQFFIDHGISGAPVIGDKEKPVGVVTLSDIAQSQLLRSGIAPNRSDPEFDVRGWEDKLNPEELSQFHIEDEGLLVQDIMTPDIYTVSESTSVVYISKMMIESCIHRVFVVRDYKLVGVVTTFDMLKLIHDPLQ